MDATAQELLDFWLGEVGRGGLVPAGRSVDAAIRERWAAALGDGTNGRPDRVDRGTESCLALIILLDQFPRNMFRDSARAFASDGRAVATAKNAILRGHDQRIRCRSGSSSTCR